MLAANMTRRLNLIAESLTCAVQSDVQVVQRQAQRHGHVLQGSAIDIYSLEQVSILFRQTGQKPLETLAQDPFSGGIRLIGEFGLQTFERTVADIAPPIQVDYRMAQNAIEPRHRAFAVRGLFGGLEGLEQAVLHEVGGQFGVAHVLARKRNKGVQVFDKGVFGLCHAPRLAVSNGTGNRRHQPSPNHGGRFGCKRISGSALARVDEAEYPFISKQRISL
jgi:hypothetical protein